MGKELMKFRPLRADEIECRVARINDKGVQLLLYKDARADMILLDETVGAMNWQREHYEAHGNLFCRVGIKNEDSGEWVYKSDAGAPSNTEAEKGHASDSFKRACSNWGIGRELYTSPFIWVQLREDEYAERGTKSRLKPSVKFAVMDIQYNEGVITGLTILDQNGEVRYEKGKTKDLRPPAEPQETPKTQSATKPSFGVCSACGEKITDAEWNYSTKKFNKPLCRTHQKQPPTLMEQEAAQMKVEGA